MPNKHVGTLRVAGRRAFSMVETVVSIVIVGGLLVASMNAAGAAVVGQQKTGDRGRGMLLAQALMDEILRREYEDPDLPSGSFGLESVEVGDNSRALWDDVDDYNGWSASPLEARDGTPMSDLVGWGRSVTVRWVSATDLSTVSGTNTGVKRIVVTVTRSDVPVAQLCALRTGPPGGRVLDPRKPIATIK